MHGSPYRCAPREKTSNKITSGVLICGTSSLTAETSANLQALRASMSVLSEWHPDAASCRCQPADDCVCCSRLSPPAPPAFSPQLRAHMCVPCGAHHTSKMKDAGMSTDCDFSRLWICLPVFVIPFYIIMPYKHLFICIAEPHLQPSVRET